MDCDCAIYWITEFPVQPLTTWVLFDDHGHLISSRGGMMNMPLSDAPRALGLGWPTWSGPDGCWIRTRKGPHPMLRPHQISNKNKLQNVTG